MMKRTRSFCWALFRFLSASVILLACLLKTNNAQHNRLLTDILKEIDGLDLTDVEADDGDAVGLAGILKGNLGRSRHGLSCSQRRMCQCYSRVLRKWFCCDCLTGPCFPGTATAVVYPGKGVAMHSLQPGDRVLAVDPTGGNLIWTRVLAFLDRRPEELAEYLHLETDLHTSLAVSANHVLLTPGDDANNNGSTSASSCQGFGYQSRFAADIRPGERLFVASGNSVLTAEVRTIKRTIEKGAFVPLTAEGNLIVDGTLASCYATFHHDWSHMALRPLISVVQQWPASQHTVQAFTGHYVSFLKWAGNVLLPEGRLKFGDKRNTGVLKTISPGTSPLDLVDSYAKKCFFSILTSV